MNNQGSKYDESEMMGEKSLPYVNSCVRFE